MISPAAQMIAGVHPGEIVYVIGPIPANIVQVVMMGFVAVFALLAWDICKDKGSR